MANQPPPVRPWFRLGSVGRPAPPTAPAPPAPEPVRPPMPRPAFLPIAQTAPPPAAAPPQETVAPRPPPIAPSGTSVPGVASLPTSPVETIPTATAAPPKTKPTAPPPSSLVLPPAKLKSQAENEPQFPPEAVQKTVLVQKTIEKPKGWSNGDSHKGIGVTNGNQESYKGGETNGNGKKLLSDSDKRSVITITGENRGAVMELIQSPQKHGFEGKPHHLQKKGNSTNKGEELHNYSSSSSSSSDAEDGKHKKKDKDLKSKAKPMHAYVNSNVQGVNSSLVYNSTCDFHDPGVRLTLPRKLNGGGEGGNGGGNGKNK
ncbi:hypothetical protein SLA2020_512800 [Shorea laevis]